MSLLIFAFLLAAGGSQATPPKLLNSQSIVTADDYPAASLQNGEQGSVQIRLTIDESGRVTQCTVLRSSGHRALDDQTCALYRARARFEPARNEAGRPMETEFTQKVTWKIGSPLLMPRSQWMTRMTIGLSASGEIVSCTMESAGIGLDSGDCQAPGQKRDSNAEPSGHAISETYFYPVDPTSAPATPELENAILASRQLIKITISPDGQIVACEAIAFSGAAMTRRDKCLMLTNVRFQELPGGSGPTVGTLVQSDYVKGTAADSKPQR